MYGGLGKPDGKRTGKLKYTEFKVFPPYIVEV